MVVVCQRNELSHSLSCYHYTITTTNNGKKMLSNCLVFRKQSSHPKDEIQKPLGFVLNLEYIYFLPFLLEGGTGIDILNVNAVIGGTLGSL